MNRLDLSSQLVMDAVWFVLPAGADQPERTHRSRLTEAAGAGAPGDLAPALSRAVEKLSREIAAELAGQDAAR